MKPFETIMIREKLIILLSDASQNIVYVGLTASYMKVYKSILRHLKSFLMIKSRRREKFLWKVDDPLPIWNPLHENYKHSLEIQRSSSDIKKTYTAEVFLSECYSDNLNKIPGKVDGKILIEQPTNQQVCVQSTQQYNTDVHIIHNIIH